MRRAVGEFELDDDWQRVDLGFVHAFLSNESYWARGRSLELVERSLQRSDRVVGCYRAGRQVGFARVVSDGVSFAYLADVFVISEFRGQGLGLEIVREAVDRGPHTDLLWLLGTEDAHELYAKLGFGPTTARRMERPARLLYLDDPATAEALRG
jgi:GNAT superfamily N-acetyltransferase